MSEIKYVKAITFKHKLIKPNDVNTVISILEIYAGAVASYKIFSKVIRFHFENNIILKNNSNIIKDIEDNISLMFKEFKFV